MLISSLLLLSRPGRPVHRQGKFLRAPAGGEELATAFTAGPEPTRLDSVFGAQAKGVFANCVSVATVSKSWLRCSSRISTCLRSFSFSRRAASRSAP